SQAVLGVVDIALSKDLGHVVQHHAAALGIAARAQNRGSIDITELGPCSLEADGAGVGDVVTCDIQIGRCRPDTTEPNIERHDQTPFRASRTTSFTDSEVVGQTDAAQAAQVENHFTAMPHTEGDTVNVRRQQRGQLGGFAIDAVLGLETVFAGRQGIAAGILTVPGEVADSGFLGPEVDGSHHAASLVIDVDQHHLAGLGQHQLAGKAFGRINHGPVTGKYHGAPDHGGGLQGLGRLEAAGHGIDTAVHLLDAFDGAELGQLGNELAVFLGRQRVLVVQLGYQKLQELALAQLVTLGKAPLIHLVLVKHTAADTDAHSL